MDDLFIDRHKSELRAGITHRHHHYFIDRVVSVEKESDKAGEGGSNVHRQRHLSWQGTDVIIGGNDTGMIVKQGI